MHSSIQLTLASFLALSPLAALAKTDLEGCTTFTSTVTIDPTSHEYGNVYQSLVYYDPDTLEICTVPDCGGGRAAPKTGVPGCPLYSGTATPTPSFLTADPLAPASTTTATATSSGAAETATAASSSSSGSGSASSASSASTTVIVVTGTDGSANETLTMVSGGVQPTAASTGVEASSTGTTTATPSSSVNSSSGAVSRVAVGALSGAFGLAVVFLV